MSIGLEKPTSPSIKSWNADEDAPEGGEPRTDDKELTSDEIDGASEYPHGMKLAVIVLAIVLSIFLASLDMTIVATAIPKITDQFGGLNDVSWYGAAFFMTNGGFQSSWGKAYKYFPLKWTFIASIIVFELGSLICGAAPNSIALIVGRAVTGVGAAGIGTGAYTIIAFIAEPHKRARYTGAVGMSYGIAAVLGPLIGGALTDKVSWRWCFYINLPIGGVSAIVIWLFFHAPKGAQPIAATWKEKFLQMDFIGVAMIMGALVSYLLALQYGGQTRPWSSSVVIGLLVGCVVIFVLFGIWERFQGERAMIVPRLFKNRKVGISCVYVFFFAGSYFVVIYYLPIYFQSVDNTTPTMSGVYNLPLIVAVSLCTSVCGFIIVATGHAVPLLVVGSAFALLGSGLLYTLETDTSTAKWAGYQILAGIGWGLALQVPIIMGQSSASAEDMSSITAMVLFSMNFGGTIFVTAAQSAFVNTMTGALPANADPMKVVATGATQIRSAFPAEQVPGIISAYMAGLKVAFAIIIGATGMAFLVGFGNRWERLHSQQKKVPGNAAQESETA